MAIALIIFFSILIISFITGVILTKQEAKKNNIVSVSESSNSEEIIQPESSLFDDGSDDQSSMSDTIEQEVPQSILDFVKDSDIECLTLYPENEGDSSLDVSGVGDEQPYIFSNYVEPSKQVYDSSEIDKIVEEANTYSDMLTDNSQNITNQSENSISDFEENNIQTDNVSDDM